METVKYIVKRLLLSILILFGVSVIIYGLARMMPTDFVDQQFAGAIQQGTMKQEDLDRIKELYGLNMPDAYLHISPGEGSKYAGEKFTKNTKESIYDEDVKLGGLSYGDWYTGTYTGSGNHQLRVEAPNEIVIMMDGSQLVCTLDSESRRLTVAQNAKIKCPSGGYRLTGDNGIDQIKLESNWVANDDSSDYSLSFNRGTCTYLEVNERAGSQVEYTFGYTYRGSIKIGKSETKVTTVVYNEGTDEEFSEIITEDTFDENIDEAGTYTIELTEAQSGDRGIIRQMTVNLNGETVNFGVSYKKATFWNKAGSVLGSYFKWLGNMLKGDLGLSFKYKKPVADVILQNMGISFAIAFVATILQFVIAIPLGIKAAVNQYGVIDYTVTVFTMMGISLPTFFLAALVIRVFAVGLNWFEVGGLVSASLAGAGVPWIVRLGDMLWHMVLPMFVLVILSIGGLMRYTRTNTLEALNADYVRTARAKGLSEKSVIYKHAFRNTMVPLVTLLAGILPSLFGGAMITETVFAIPGIGKLAYDALVVADVPFIMGYNMFLAVMTVLGTLFSDLMYAVVDPRVKIGK